MQARREAEHKLETGGFLYALDVAAARRGVSPLPFGIEPRPSDFTARVVGDATDVARQRGSRKVVTAQLLLALVRARGDYMLEVLSRLGIDATTAEKRLLDSEQFKPGGFTEPVPTAKYLGVQKVAAVLAQMDQAAVVGEKHLIRALDGLHSSSLREALSQMDVSEERFETAIRAVCQVEGPMSSFSRSRRSS
jgi:ATP-dependent Clp protease ATP-binding subunit ClpA